MPYFENDSFLSVVSQLRQPCSFQTFSHKTQINYKLESFLLTMSTRSQKRRYIPQENSGNVGENMVSPVVVENEGLVYQDALLAGLSRTKSPRVENSSLERLRVSLKEEMTSEIKNLLAETQRELLQLLKPKTGECIDEEEKTLAESETRSFYTPTKSIRINSTQNNHSCTSRNTRTIRRITIRNVCAGRCLVCGTGKRKFRTNF